MLLSDNVEFTASALSRGESELDVNDDDDDDDDKCLPLLLSLFEANAENL